MSHITGIGGVFFRSRDTQALKDWYRKHLGIDGPDGFWHQDAGDTVFEPFKQTSDYFPSEKQWMINFRVSDMDGLVAKLEGAGIVVETSEEWDAEGYGRFARIHDPEGNPIELWEPASP